MGDVWVKELNTNKVKHQKRGQHGVVCRKVGQPSRKTRGSEKQNEEANLLIEDNTIKASDIRSAYGT